MHPALRTIALLVCMAAVATSCVWVGLASVDENGNNVSGGIYSVRDISFDGRYTLFDTTESLVAGDTNSDTDVYRRDNVSGAVELVSQTTSGAAGDDRSKDGEISDDGRYVVFTSWATDLIPGNPIQGTQVYLRDLLLGTTTLMSVAPNGDEAAGTSRQPVISGDGGVVAFESLAENLVPATGTAGFDIFGRDLATGTTVLVSTPLSGVAADGPSTTPTINADGTVIAFESDATNLVPGDTNGVSDIYAKHFLGLVLRVSVSASGAQSNGRSKDPSINAAGTAVAFESDATNLVPNDNNGEQDIFVKLLTGAIARASVTDSGAEATGGSRNAVLSADGTRVAFDTNSADLTGLTSGFGAVVRDGLHQQTDMVSVDSDGNPVNAVFSSPVISGNGDFVAFVTASSLTAGDTDTTDDVYVLSYPFPQILVVSPTVFDPGDAGTIVIQGRNFEDPVLILTNPDITVSNIVVQDRQNIIASITVDTNAQPGPHFLAVQNGNQGAGFLKASGDVCVGCITIN